MAAYRDSEHGPVVLAAFLLWLAAGLGVVGIVLWRLWTALG